MTTTAFDDQYLAAPEPVRQLYDTAAILRRNVADLELALKQQAERAEAAEAELAKLAQQKPAVYANLKQLKAIPTYGKTVLLKTLPQDGLSPLYAAPVPALGEAKRLQAENERLRKDAERYQWLRELVSSKDGTIQAQGLFWNCSHSRRKLDAALDAAQSAKTLPEPAP